MTSDLECSELSLLSLKSKRQRRFLSYYKWKCTSKSYSYEIKSLASIFKSIELNWVGQTCCLKQFTVNFLGQFHIEMASYFHEQKKNKIFYPKPTLKWVFHFKLTKKMQLRPLSPLTGVANAFFSFVPYLQTINLVTTFDLVTLFGLTKSVTKSEVDCIV